jgi:hypothetical protein
MIFVGTTIKNDFGDFLSNGSFGERLADHDGFFGFGAFNSFETFGTNCGNYNARLIVNKLSPNMSVGS